MYTSILQSGRKIALAITGGGTEVIGELLRYGGGSSAIVEVVVPYSPQSLDAFIKGKPDKYCSEDTAGYMAMAAFKRCLSFTGDEENSIGLGATSSLCKEGEREGREHRTFICLQTAHKTIHFSLLHNKNHIRELQENVVAYHSLRMLVKECNNQPLYNCLYHHGDEYQTELLLGKRKAHTVIVDRDLPHTVIRGNLQFAPIIFPGSFNPFHTQHENIARTISRIMGQKVDIEICVNNIDKPSLTYKQMRDRIDQFSQYANDGWLNRIHLTNTPSFLEKSNCFPGAQFIVGFDTLQRIGDLKYGNVEEVLDVFEKNGTKFLLVHRIVNGKSTEGDLGKIHPGLLKFTNIVSDIELSALASSDLRRKG